MFWKDPKREKIYISLSNMNFKENRREEKARTYLSEEEEKREGDKERKRCGGREERTVGEGKRTKQHGRLVSNQHIMVTDQFLLGG